MQIKMVDFDIDNCNAQSTAGPARYYHVTAIYSKELYVPGVQ